MLCIGARDEKKQKIAGYADFYIP